MKFPFRIIRGLINLVSSARFVVRGNSMQPALKSRESVLAVRSRLPWNRLRRGDIVVFRQPDYPGRVYIKRIVGLPNEDIRLEDGLVHLKGALLEETYIDGLDGLFPGRQDQNREWWTGPDEYFVLGDNRGGSQDSRAFGPVARRLILGRVWFRCWPPRSWGPVPGRGGLPR